MDNLWQQITLSNLSLTQWRSASLIYRWVGLLQSWRRGSWLIQWADLIALGLVSLVLVLAPFVPNALTGVLLVACAGFWVLLTLADDPKSTTGKLTPIHLMVLLYWSIVTIATAMSPVKKAAMVGLGKFSLYLLLFVLMARLLRSPRFRSWLIGVYLLVALLVSVYGLNQAVYGAPPLATWVDPASPLSKATRVYSYLGNPNLLAGYLLPAVAFSVAAFFVWKRWAFKALALTMVGANVVCLYFTRSRGGYIGLVVLALVMVMLLMHWWSRYLPRPWNTLAIPIALASLVGLLAVAFLLVEPLRDRVSSMFLGRSDTSNNFRINVWNSVLAMIRDRPVLGIGPGNTVFNRIYPFYQRPGFTALSAYSIFLEIAVEAGLIGLGCFLWLLTVTFNQGWQQLQRLRAGVDRQGFWLIAAIATIAGMLGHGLVDTVWYRPEVSTLWWLSVAWVAGYYMPKQPEEAVEG